MNIAARTDVARIIHIVRRFQSGTVEEALAGLSLVGMVLLPSADVIARGLGGFSVPGAVDYTQHLSLWVGFMGAAAAVAAGRHVRFAGQTGYSGWWQSRLCGIVASAVCMLLAWAGWQFVQTEAGSPGRVGGLVSVWVFAAVMPLGFGAMAVHFVRWGEGVETLVRIALAATLAMVFWDVPDAAASWLVWPLVAALIGLAFVGLPVFVVIGGVGLALFYGDALPIAAIPVEAFRVVVSPTIPAIPLFTLTGILLAGGNAAQRIVDVFYAWFGWFQGGVICAAILVCAFFSAFTGASGITIVAMGSLLLPVLLRSGTGRGLSIGVLTSTGSIGLLFPPSLAVILYAVVAQVSIADLFVAAALPGVMMIVAVLSIGLWRAPRQRSCDAFDLRKALMCTWRAKWELGLPVLVLVLMFGGFVTLIEAAAVSAMYAFAITFVVHRDRRLRDLPELLTECAVLLGGIFAIISVAMGLSNYLTDAMVPLTVLEWIRTHIEAKWVFLVALNLMLLGVGCVMDIFSAILVVLPLIVPASAAFGIDPLHLGVIFLINLEIGYLTPPVGMNLFLAALKFKCSVPGVCRSVLPFFPGAGSGARTGDVHTGVVACFDRRLAVKCN